eukprot:gene7969-9471_t
MFAPLATETTATTTRRRGSFRVDRLGMQSFSEYAAITDPETAEPRVAEPSKIRQFARKLFTRRFWRPIASISITACLLAFCCLAYHDREKARLLHDFDRTHGGTIPTTRRCMYDAILNIAVLIVAEREAALLFTSPKLERRDDATLAIARTRDGASHPYYNGISLTFHIAAVYSIMLVANNAICSIIKTADM